jgi:pimeloyl-ACP methyl ester carboxylesterase
MSDIYLTTATGHSVSYRFYQGEHSVGHAEQDTLIFLSGLADCSTVWLRLIENLKTLQSSILLVNLIGQGSALEEDFKKELPSFRVSIEDQAEALKMIFDHAQITHPVSLIGFSYGGAVALEFQKENPALVRDLHLWLPYVMRLDFANPMMRAWRQNAKTLSSWNPAFNFMFHRWNYAYQDWLEHYMHFRYSKRVPDPRLRQVAVEMSQGAIDFDGMTLLENLKDSPVHLIISHMDTLVPLTLYHRIWESIPQSLRGSCLRVRDGAHLLHEQSPLLLANWLEFCFRGNLNKGQEYNGWAQSGLIDFKSGIHSDLRGA